MPAFETFMKNNNAMIVLFHLKMFDQFKIGENAFDFMRNLRGL